MDLGMGNPFVLLLIGYAAGATMFLILGRGRAAQTVVVVPESAPDRSNEMGCGLIVALLVLMATAFALLLKL
jgi:hypothetical protein